MDLTEQQEQIIRRWAASTRYVKAVRLFESRPRGGAPLDSDVDLAVTVGGATSDEARGNYYAEARRWRRELTALLGLKAHVNL
jgi:predicted nucleotidyltransferase